MTQKTIALPDDIYMELKKRKQKGESFADLVGRLIQGEQQRKNDLDELAGAFEEDDEWDQILLDIYKDREKPARISDEAGE
jgi:predicted CopG family antitoxin